MGGFRAALNQVREEEARRIAHSLHHEASQLVAAAHLELEDLARRAGIEPALLAGVRARLDEIGSRLRSLSHELRPAMLDDLGLVPAVEFVAQGLATRTGMQVAVQSALAGRLPPPAESALYRIICEALRNAANHGRARTAVVRLAPVRNAVQCTVRDNGSGFSVPGVRSGLGLIGIRERAEALGGTLRVSSRPGEGTELTVHIPNANPAGG